MAQYKDGPGLGGNATSRHDFADAVDARLAAAWAEYEAAQESPAGPPGEPVSLAAFASPAADVRMAGGAARPQLAARGAGDHGVPRSDLRRALDRFVTHGAPTEGILAVLGSAPVERQLAMFDRLDALALAEQRRYWRAGWITRRASLLSVVVAPFLLLSADGMLPAAWGIGAHVLHSVMLGLTALTLLAMVLRRPVGRWKQARYQAEKARAEVFRLIVRSSADPAQLQQALACFRIAHLDWQTQFYCQRIADLPRRVDADRRSLARSLLARVMLAVGLLAVGISAGLSAVLSAVVPHGLPLPDVPALHVLESLRHWPLHGAAFSLLAFAGARSWARDLRSTRALSPVNAHHRALYRWAKAELQRLGGELGRIEKAAAAGDLGAVLEFRDRVQYVLDAENLIWAMESAEQEQEDSQRAAPAGAGELAATASFIRP